MSAGGEALIGPNAVTQLAAACGPDLAARVFGRAGRTRLLADPPKSMTPAADAAALFEALYTEAPQAMADAVTTDAGRRVAEYVLAHRIPKFAKAILRRAPRSIAAPMLMRAIAANAATFAAGEGRCRLRLRAPRHIEIAANPLNTPGGRWHAAVIGRLFEALVDPRAVVAYSPSGSGCRFSIILGASPKEGISRS